MTTFETKQPIALWIELSQGAVHVIASERADTVVAVQPTDRHRAEDVDAAAKTAVDLANGTLSVRSPKPRGITGHLVGWRRGGSVDVVVELPEGSSLHAEAGVAHVRCDGRLADVDVKTGVGDVRLDRTDAVRVHSGVGQVALEEAAGRAEIVTVGTLTLGVLGGDAEVKNRNGKTWIGRVAGTASIRSANGDITIEDVGRDATVKTANGTIRLGRVARGSVNVETAAGGLEIGVKEGTAAWIDASTKFGRVHNNLTSTEDPGPSDETVEVHARTSFGDVVIARS